MTVLDHIVPIEVPGDVFNEPTNEYWALICLAEGLEYLHRQVRKCDEAVRQQVNPDGKAKLQMMGIMPAGLPMGLLTCSYHWYAVTACQYVRTIGAIAWKRDQSRPQPLDYVKMVIPEVLAFRDKVAAHFSWTTKHPEDSNAERAASVMPLLTFENDAFFVGGFQLTIRSHGETSTSAAIRRWCIRDVHARLCERYWPAAV